MKKNKKNTRNFLLIKLIFLLLISCSNDNTSTGNPLVSIELSDYNTSLLKVDSVSVLATSSITMCFKRLRFKIAGETTESDSSLDNDNIDFSLGPVVLQSTGTSLGNINVPAGQYVRIEFDLEKDCDGTTQPSVIVDNDNDAGTPFQTDDRITIKFEGDITISNNQSLLLAIGNIITQAALVTNNTEIKTLLESSSATGGF